METTGEILDLFATDEVTIDETLDRLVGSTGLPALYRRSWVLALFHAAESFGITPVAQRDAHALVFLANALAPVYELLAPDRAVLKAVSGPFFSTVQWDLDRLCAQRLLAFESISTGSTDESVAYSCTEAGQRLVLNELRGSPLVERTIGYLQEVASAFVSAGVATGGVVVPVDATYASQATIGSVLDFGEWESAFESNYSFRTTQAFETVNARGIPFLPRERLHLYLRYLELARVGAAA